MGDPDARGFPVAMQLGSNRRSMRWNTGARPGCKCDSRDFLYEIPYASAVVAWHRKHLYIIDECNKLMVL